MGPFKYDVTFISVQNLCHEKDVKNEKIVKKLKKNKKSKK